MTKQSNHVCLPLPAFAIPVQVSLDQKDHLNVLEKAILRLTKLKPRTLDELCDLLSPDGDSLSPEMIESAIDLLTDLGWLNMDAKQDTFSANFELDELSPSLSFSPGWVLLMPNGRLAQTVILGARKPAEIREHELLEAVEFCVEWARTHRREQPKAKELSRELAKSVSRQFRAYDQTSDDFSGQNICNVQLDEQRYKGGRGVIPSLVWTRVDLVQRLSGPPLQITHEPDVVIIDALTPIVDDVMKLIQDLEPVHQVLESLTRGLHKSSSEVLRFTDIADEAQLDELTVEYGHDLARRSGIPFPADSSQFKEEMASVWAWYVIARANPKFVPQGFDQISHASERLTRLLFLSTETYLDGWKREYRELTRAERKEFRNERNLEWHHQRVSLFRLGELLKASSLRHIASWIEECNYNDSKLGAGTYLLYWILPLFLLDETEAETYSTLFFELQNIAPDVIDDLNALVDTRNSVFHSREEESKSLDDLNLALYRVWSSLASTGFLSLSRP